MTRPTEQAIERAAEALAGCDDVHFANATRAAQSRYRHRARAALASDLGDMVLVPREATAAKQRAISALREGGYAYVDVPEILAALADGLKIVKK